MLLQLIKNTGIFVTTVATCSSAPLPRITNISPATGSTAGGTSITITGTDFTGATAVTIGGAAATNVSVVSATSITARTPSGAAGSASVLVTTPGGTNSANSLFTYLAAPTVTGVNPTAGKAGLSATITGTNFSATPANNTVKFGGVAATVTAASATQLTATVPTGTQGSNVDVTVETSGGTSATGAATKFHYSKPLSVSATFQSPYVVPGGTANLVLTITNSDTVQEGFYAFDVNHPTSEILAGGASGSGAFSYSSNATRFQLRAGLPASAPIAAGASLVVTVPYSVPSNTTHGAYSVTIPTITSQYGSLDTSGTTASFSVGVAPTVTGVAPNTGPLAGGRAINIGGTNFTGATGVTIGGVPATNVVVVRHNYITATTPAGSLGAASVIVTTPGGSNAANSFFNYVLPEPTVTDLSVRTGPASGGTAVTITGTNFFGTPQVMFGGAAASNVTLVSETSITAESPAGAGVVNVVITTLGGTSATSSADEFTYISPPTTTAFDGPAIAYNVGAATATTFSAAAYATNSPTSYAVDAVTGGGGTVSVTNAGLISYTPPVGMRGNDIFYFTATNAGGTSGGARVTVVVGNPTLSTVLNGSGASRGAALSGYALSTTGGAATYSCSTTLASGALPSGVSLGGNCALSGTPTAAGTFTFTASVSDSSTGTGPFTQTSGTLSLTVAKANQTITFANPGAKAFGTTPTLTASASSGLTVVFAAVPGGVCTVTSGGVLAFSSAGNCIITADQAGDSDWNAATQAARSFTVTKADQTITLNAPGAQAFGTTLTLAATVSSGLPISFDSATTGVCTVNSGGVVSFGATGTCTITADQAGNGSYNAATQASQSFTVDKANQTITFGALSNASLSASPLTLSATASSGLTVGFASATTGTCTVSGTSLTLLATGTCTLNADQAGNASYNAASQVQRSFTVTPANLTVNSTAPSGAKVGAAYSQANPASGGTAPYAYALASGALPLGTTLNTSTGLVSGTPTTTGVVSYTIQATDSQGSPVTATGGWISVSIIQGAQTITFANPGSHTFGATPTLTATATSGLEVEFTSSTTGVCAITSEGVLTFITPGTCTINADQAGSGNYDAAPRVSQSFTVSASAPIAGDVFGASAGYNTTGANFNLAPFIVGGTATSIAIVSPPTNGTTSIAGKVVTYIPTTGYYGADTFTYTAAGPGGTSNVGTVYITVTTPGAPVAANRTGVAIAYNSSGTAIDLAASISGVHSSIAIGSAATHGTTSITGDVVTYIPATGYYGSDSFTYTATGPGGTSSPATVSVTVATPTAPTAAARSGVSVSYNSGGTAIDLSASITGVHSSIAIGSAPAHGTTSIAGNVVTYIPAAGYYGADSFTYTATGPGGTSAPASISLNVAMPPPPVATDKSVTVAYNSSAIAIDLSASVTGVHTAIAIGAPPAHGTTSIAGEVVTYTPTSGYYGADSFTFTATGPGGTSLPATVTLTVAAPPAPVAADKAGVAIPYNSAGTAIDLSTSVSGVHASLAIGAAPLHGTVSVAGDVVTYTPTSTYFGADSFTYTVTGPGGTSAPATVSVTVALPPAPVAANKSGVAVAYNSSGASIDLTASVTGVTSSIAVATAPAHGTATLAGDVVTYTPTTGYLGTDSFTFTATGPGGTSAPATVSLTVAASAPVAVADTATTPANQVVVIDAGANDTGLITSLAVTTAPGHGTAVVEGLKITYNPARDYFGADTLSYKAVGPGGDSAPVAIGLTVTALPPPVAQPLPPTTVPLDGVTTGESIVFFISPDGAPTITSGTFSNQSLATNQAVVSDYTVSVVTQPAHGTAVVSGHNIIYTPNVGYAGPDPFTYQITNVFGASAPANIAVTVALPPAAKALTARTAAHTPVTVEITAGADHGPFIAASIVSVTTGSGAATTALMAGQTGRYEATFTPSSTFVGNAVVTYTLTSVFGTSQPATLTVTVDPRPDPALDPDVKGLIGSQNEAAKRFATTQIQNFSRRLESLHGGADGGFASRDSFAVNLDGSAFALRQLDDPREAMNPMRDAAMLNPGFLAPGRESGEGPGGKPGGGLSLGSSPSARPQSPMSALGQELMPDGTSVWASGTVTLGRRSSSAGQSGVKFTTNGLSAGLDRAFGKRLVLGVGAGWGETDDEIGTLGTQSEAKSWMGVVYGSINPVSNLYVDGQVGYGGLAFRSRRQTAGAMVYGTRDGSLTTGALSAAWEHREGALHLSPYGRLELARGSLDAFTETGDPMWALTYGAQKATLVMGVLGARGDYLFEKDWGAFSPSFRVEYRYDFNGSQASTLEYADLVGGPVFTVIPNLARRDNLVVGLGAEWAIRDSWKLSLDVDGGLNNGDERATRYTLRGARGF